jgi:hypothetical protein
LTPTQRVAGNANSTENGTDQDRFGGPGAGSHDKEHKDMTIDDTSDPQPEGGTTEPLEAAQLSTARAVHQEALDGAELFSQIATDADAIRKKAKYAGRLTAKVLVALGEVLRRPTPGKYVQHIPRQPGKPYDSTGLTSSQYQICYMNAAFGRAHWRMLRHYPTQRAGFLCKVVVIVGNNLVSASLDADGELIVNKADVLALSEEWGSVTYAAAPGDAYKGSATNASKRALAAFGPGSDVFRLEFEDENLGGVGSLEAPSSTGGPRQAADQPAARGVAQPAKATQGMRAVVRAHATKIGLDDGQLANVIRRVADAEPLAFGSREDAATHLETLMKALPRDLVEPTLSAIAATSAGDPAATSRDGDMDVVGDPAAVGAAGVTHIGGSDFPPPPVSSADGVDVAWGRAA